MIETKSGYDNLDDILSLSGIDVIAMGPSDFSASYGRPGRSGDPDIKAAMEDVYAKSRAKGIICENFISASDLVEATPDTGAYVSYSSALKRLAIKLSKICNDLRLMASGPRCGLNEINLPPKAPGSSIMPGKVNPVIPEVTNQVCFKVIGNDTTVSFAAEAGQLELNVMEPIITESLFESLTWLRNVIETLTEECILGITVNKEHCYEMVKNSIGIVTALNPIIGYKKSSMVAKEAHDTGRSVYDIVIEKGLMTKEELDKALDPKEMLQSHKFTLK